MSTLTKHIHADLIVERARQDATGETAAGWWQWEFYIPFSVWADVPRPLFPPEYSYRYSRTPAHPHFTPPTPKPQLVDMTALPKGTMVRTLRFNAGTYIVYGQNNENLWLVDPVYGGHTQQLFRQIRITEQKEFTYWGGGACPVPDGLEFESVWRDGGTRRGTTPTKLRWTNTRVSDDIIAYRILGLADGWTDDPTQSKGKS